jgi:hypothetical protein
MEPFGEEVMIKDGGGKIRRQHMKVVEKHNPIMKKNPPLPQREALPRAYLF